MFISCCLLSYCATEMLLPLFWHFSCIFWKLDMPLKNIPYLSALLSNSQQSAFRPHPCHPTKLLSRIIEMLAGAWAYKVSSVVILSQVLTCSYSQPWGGGSERAHCVASSIINSRKKLVFCDQLKNLTALAAWCFEEVWRICHMLLLTLETWCSHCTGG